MWSFDSDTACRTYATDVVADSASSCAVGTNKITTTIASGSTYASKMSTWSTIQYKDDNIDADAVTSKAPTWMVTADNLASNEICWS